MQNVDGDMNLLEEALDIFINTVPEQFESLKSSLDNLDMQMICGLAHKIKGAARTIGASSIADIAQKIENDAGENHSECLVNFIYEMENDLNKLRDLIADKPLVQVLGA